MPEVSASSWYLAADVALADEAAEGPRAMKFGVKASATSGVDVTANNAVNATDDGFMVGGRLGELPYFVPVLVRSWHKICQCDDGTE